MTASYHLRLLGQFELISPAGVSVGFATKKAAALLAFLARQPGYRASRERLAALLWEGDDTQALQSLRSALSSIRKSTEAALLMGDNDAVALARDKILIDVTEFEACVTGGAEGIATFQRAGELYKGDFLEGFTVRNAPAFAEWTETERQQLRTIALEALSTLMEQLATSGASAEAAMRAALQVIALDPLQERAHRALMRLHVRQGRHSAALKHYHALSERLRSELGVAPEPATQELFHQITANRRTPAPESRSSEFPPDGVSALSGSELSSDSGTERHTAALQTKASRTLLPKTRWIAAGVAAVALVAGAAVVNWVPEQRPTTSPVTGSAHLPAKSVAVLPFANFSAEPDAGFFADGLTEELINSLAQLPDLKIPGRTSSFYFKGRNTDLREIGRKLGVAYVIEGSVRQSGKRLRVTAQLVSVKDGFHLWSKTYDRTLDDAFSIQSNIADDVAEALNLQLAATAIAQQKLQTPKAYRTYLVAKAHLANRGAAELKAARTLFAALMKAEPNNAMPYAGYAMATLLLSANYLAIDPTEALRTAGAAIERALQLAPRSSDAYIAKGIYHRNLALRDVRAAHDRHALQAFRYAVQLAPRDPQALGWYGVQLVRLDQPAPAIRHLQLSLSLDPLDRNTQIQLGHAFRRLGRLNDAFQQYKTVSDLYPDFAPPKLEAGRVLVSRGRLDEAEPWVRAAVSSKDAPLARFELAILYENLGMAAEAKAVLKATSGPAHYVAFAPAAELLLDQEYQELIAYAEARKALPPTLVWRELILVGAALVGDYPRARQGLQAILPTLFEAVPVLDAKTLEWAPLVAHVLNRTGEQNRAQHILKSVLEATNIRPGVHQPVTNRIVRMTALAELGQRDQALAELRKAIDLGYRTPINAETYIHISEHPSLSGMRNDAQFLAMLHDLERDNARMRQIVQSKPNQFR